jgi:glycosyltransferase involved in cell wall biosynthesis
LERALERWLVTRARYDHLITVAENFRQLPNRNAAISVIPNGVDLERFAQPRSWPEQFRLLFVGRFDPIKGAHVLIEAMALLARRGRKFPLTLVGFGPQEPKLRELVAQHGLDDGVTFAGKVTGDALVAAYGAHSLLVLPSLSEGLPLTPLEAWAARRPVLATAVGDNPLYVREGETGFLVPPGDAGALADAIERAAGCAELRQMGERGRQLVQERFNWDRMTAEVFAVYRGVLEK